MSSRKRKAANDGGSPAGKRKALMLQERVRVLKELESGRSCQDVAAEWGCGKTQIAKIRTDKENLK